MAKTRISDHVLDGGGHPRAGIVTFILTQKSVTSPDGLIAAKATISAVLDSLGRFDVYVYQSAALSPTCYYQVWFVPSGGAQELLGVFNIPATDATRRTPRGDG